MAKTRNYLLPIAAAVALVACGGGSDNGTPGADITSGKAIDGYLSGSTVFCDMNENHVQDAGEMTTTTDSGGNYSFDALCSGPIAVYGGVDTATDYPFRGLMKSPGGTVVTPLTSLLAASDLSPEQLAAALGLPDDLDVTTTDPMLSGNEPLLKKTLAVQHILQELAIVFGTLTNPNQVPNLYAFVAHALADTIIAAPGTPLLSADGEVDENLVKSAIQQAVTLINSEGTFGQVDLTATDVSEVADQVIAETKQFLLALDADLITLAKQLQNPLKNPPDTDTAKKNYVSPKDNSFQINGNTYTLQQFDTGIAVGELGTIGVDYSITGSPKIDTIVDAAMSVNEEGGKRILQVKVEQVHIKRDASGTMTLDYTPDTKVHVYARDAEGTSFNASVTDVSFNPITIENNALTFNYNKLVERITTDAQNDTMFKAEHFIGVTGTFDIELVVSNNFNLRYEGGEPLPVTNIGIFNTDRGVTGPGIIGRLTLTGGGAT